MIIKIKKAETMVSALKVKVTLLYYSKKCVFLTIK